MHAIRRSAPWLALALVPCLTACQAFSRPWTKPTPPLASNCLAVPTTVYPNPPARPDQLTDRYVIEMEAWANRVLGVATQDRIAWRGERTCLRALIDAGQIR